MSEDRLERALEAMRNESVPDAELSLARGRVFEKLTPPTPTYETPCARFQVQLNDYLESRLSDSRRMLMFWPPFLYLRGNPDIDLMLMQSASSLEFVHFDHVKHVIVIEIEKEACLSGTRSNALKGRSITAQGKAQRAAALGTGYKYTAALKGQGNMVQWFTIVSRC